MHTILQSKVSSLVHFCSLSIFDLDPSTPSSFIISLGATCASFSWYSAVCFRSFSSFFFCTKHCCFFH
ncbi:unnamed protein product [Arabidopsis halleri]